MVQVHESHELWERKHNDQSFNWYKYKHLLLLDAFSPQRLVIHEAILTFEILRSMSGDEHPSHPRRSFSHKFCLLSIDISPAILPSMMTRNNSYIVLVTHDVAFDGGSQDFCSSPVVLLHYLSPSQVPASSFHTHTLVLTPCSTLRRRSMLVLIFQIDFSYLVKYLSLVQS